MSKLASNWSHSHVSFFKHMYEFLKCVVDTLNLRRCDRSARDLSNPPASQASIQAASTPSFKLTSMKSEKTKMLAAAEAAEKLEVSGVLCNGQRVQAIFRRDCWHEEMSV